VLFPNRFTQANLSNLLDVTAAMKPSIFAFVCLTGLVLAQDKPRVFVQGKGSQDVTTSGGSRSSRSTVDSHDEGMEVTKDLQKNCADVIVTVNQSSADYTVILNRESKHNRGLLRTNSQIQVANRLGEVLGADATRTVGNAAKNACQLILADWRQRGRVPAPDSPVVAPVVAPVAPAAAPAVAQGARVQTVSVSQSPHTTAAVGVNATAIKADNGGGNSGDAEANASNPAQSTGGSTAEISSDPSGADIEIDGSFVGSTPSSVGIAAGEHTVRVSKSGYQQWERALRSSTGNIRIAAVLEPIPAASAGTAHAAAQTRGPIPSPRNESLPSASGTAPSKDDNQVIAAISTIYFPGPVASPAVGPPEETLIGVSFAGNPTVRHDGVEISAVQPKGPADRIDIKSGDVILAFDAHYIFTIDEVRDELLRYKPGARVLIRYRRNQFISENYVNLRTGNP
jgi:hypothetical protein